MLARRAIAIAALACLLAVSAGCGSSRTSGEQRTTATTKRDAAGRPVPPPPPPAPPPALPAPPPLPAGTTATAQIVAGQRVVASTGCLACHRIGTSGDTDLGPNLTQIADRLPATAIRRSLLNPTAPMPSYRELSREQLDALVAYLSELRESPPGGPRCPDESDCG